MRNLGSITIKLLDLILRGSYHKYHTTMCAVVESFNFNLSTTMCSDFKYCFNHFPCAVVIMSQIMSPSKFEALSKVFDGDSSRQIIDLGKR